MNIRKPKIGLLPLTSEWFTQVGATQGSFSSLPLALNADLEQIQAALAPDMDLINPGVLASPHQVIDAIQLFQREAVEAVIIVYMTWGEDRTLIEAVLRLGDCPFLLWCYVPFERLPDPLSMPEMLRASGPVGALQASGPLKRLGKRFVTAFGSYGDPQTIQHIASYARAARLAQDLKRAVIGVLPYRCDQMSGTYVDEFRLKHELGPELKYLTTHDYRAVCEALLESQVQSFVQELRSRYPAAPNLTQAGLERGARVSLGLAEYVKQYRLDALAIEDVGEEMHRVLGLRPCLAVRALFEQVVVSMEAEIGGAVALLILQQFTGNPVMYSELFSVDPSENCLLLGHAGMQDARLANDPGEVILEPDGEYVESEPDSAWMSFRARGGTVTLLSVFCDRARFKLVIARGESLSGQRRLLGSPHAVVRLETPLASFISRALHTGMTQHFGLVHGDVGADLKMLAEILDLELVDLTE
jgi:L-arabinose isomerase